MGTFTLGIALAPILVRVVWLGIMERVWDLWGALGWNRGGPGCGILGYSLSLTRALLALLAL